jgi:hypothetical protein
MITQNYMPFISAFAGVHSSAIQYHDPAYLLNVGMNLFILGNIPSELALLILRVAIQ